MTDEQIIKAWDILAKIDFFGGQRAGRELWSDKPVDVQNEDLKNFSEDVAFIKDFINRQKAEIERLQKIIVGFMDEVGTWSNKYDVDISNIHKLPLLAKEDWNIRHKIKSEAIKEFAERLKDIFPALDALHTAMGIVMKEMGVEDKRSERNRH